MARTRNGGGDADPRPRGSRGKGAAGASPSIVGDGALDALRKRAEGWGLILHARPSKPEGGTPPRKESGGKKEGGR